MKLQQISTKEWEEANELVPYGVVMDLDTAVNSEVTWQERLPLVQLTLDPKNDVLCLLFFNDGIPYTRYYFIEEW